LLLSFACKETKSLFVTRKNPNFTSIVKVALRKLDMLDAATNIDDLRIPPANRLEALSGKREGQYFIRINDQWRICFVWRDNNVYDTEIVDYHKKRNEVFYYGYP
jgi:proteic killer suppression protein